MTEISSFLKRHPNSKFELVIEIISFLKQRIDMKEKAQVYSKHPMIFFVDHVYLKFIENKKLTQLLQELNFISTYKDTCH